MAELKVQIEAKARKAGKRPKGVVAKTLTAANGEKLRVTSVDANSASFGADFLYVFKNAVRKARRKPATATAAAKPGAKIGR